LIGLAVEHPLEDRAAPAVRWSSKTGAADADADVDRARHAFLRRFDLEHTSRLFKQILGRTRPRLREPEAADRWTWSVIAAHSGSGWDNPAAPHRLTPARSGGRFGTFADTCPNRHPAARCNRGRTVRREETAIALCRLKGWRIIERAKTSPQRAPSRELAGNGTRERRRLAAKTAMSAPCCTPKRRLC